MWHDIYIVGIGHSISFVEVGNMCMYVYLNINVGYILYLGFVQYAFIWRHAHMFIAQRQGIMHRDIIACLCGAVFGYIMVQNTTICAHINISF